MKFIVAFILLGFSWFAAPVGAQEDAKNEAFLKDLAGKRPKTVVMLFDISKSMAHQFPGREQPIIDVARPFALNLVNDSLRKGDHLILYAFDKEPHPLMDGLVEDNRVEVQGMVPSRTALSPDKGTNIRWAHYEGLKLLEKESLQKNLAYLVVLSDGFHDSPDAGDPNYLKFYIPGRLDKLPDTAESRDYQRLAQKFKSQNYGVGVQISQNGWVVETNPGPTPAVSGTATPHPTTPPPKKKTFFEENLKTILVGLGVLTAALIGLALWNLLLKPIRVGLGQPADARKSKKYALKHGQSIMLGGVGAGAFATGFAIPETKAAVASISRSGQNFSIAAAENQPDGAKVFLNGQPLAKSQPLNWGDSIRVEVPDRQAPTVSRTHSLRFDRAEVFK